ncbi:MAG: transposase [Desulfobacteraceae bacterium]|nr:MAG: transposase [Desulfobacteraceae bacterium]
MAKNTRFINDDRWKLIEPLLPKPKSNPKGGRLSIDNREVLEDILLCFEPVPVDRICRIDTQVHPLAGVDLGFGKNKVSGPMSGVNFFLCSMKKGALDWQEAFNYGSFAPAKKGGLLLALPKGAKERSGWWWSTVRVFLLEAPLPRHCPRKSSSPKKTLKR